MQFETELTMEDMQEFVQYHSFSKRKRMTGAKNYKRGLLVCLALTIILIAFSLYSFPWPGEEVYSLVMYSVELVLLVAILFILRGLHLNKITALKTWENMPRNMQRSFTGEGIASDTLDGDMRCFFAWSRVELVLFTPNLYAVVFMGGNTVFFNKQYVAGREAELESILQAHAPEEKFRRAR